MTYEHDSTPGFDIPSSLRPGVELPPHDPLIDDLYTVGPLKPVGHLPIESIYQVGDDPSAIAEISQKRGLSTSFSQDIRSFPSMSGAGRSAALYVYDDLALANLLEQNTDILQKYRWPEDLDGFKLRLEGDVALDEKQPELYKLVAWCFDDQRPEYRRPAPGEPLKVPMLPPTKSRLAKFILSMRS
jgi:hypothetical protein